MKENISLEAWLEHIGATWYNKYLDSWMDLKITHEINGMDFDPKEAENGIGEWYAIVQRYFPEKRYLWSFVILENGYAVGWNENPTNIGWSFPRSIKKIDEKDIEAWEGKNRKNRTNAGDSES